MCCYQIKCTYTNIQINTASYKNKWLLLLFQDIPNAGYFPNSIKSTGISNKDDPESGLFSIVGAVDSNEFMDADGSYQLRLVYNDGGPMTGGGTFDTIWTQTSWLMESSITGSSLGTPIGCNSQFYGLGLGSWPYEFLDGNGGLDCWWQPAGIITSANAFGMMMPVRMDSGDNAETAKVYVCTTGDCDAGIHIISSIHVRVCDVYLNRNGND